MKQITMPVWKYVLSMLISMVCGALFQYGWLGWHTARLLLAFLIVLGVINLARYHHQRQSK